MRRRIISKISESESGMLILDFLVKRYRFKNADQWMNVLSAGEVMLNGGAAHTESVLKTGDELCYEAPEAPEPEVDWDISIIYEDKDLIAVNKSGNLPCHPAGCYHKNTLLYHLKERLNVETLHLINRLDRETSGITVAAKNAVAARKISNQFLSHSVRKLYSVVIEGEFAVEMNAAGWLINDNKSLIRKKRLFIPEMAGKNPQAKAEWAETRFELIQCCDMLSLVNVELLTGRLHQIRATLCSLGYPVVGDKMYGVDENNFLRFISDQLTEDDRHKLRLQRQALHARELHLQHPSTGEPMILKAPLPDDMRSLL